MKVLTWIAFFLLAVTFLGLGMYCAWVGRYWLGAGALFIGWCTLPYQVTK